MNARIEIESGAGGQEFYPCPDTGVSVYSLEIHRGARIPPRVEPVPFGQNRNVAAVHPTGAELSYQCVGQAQGLTG